MTALATPFGGVDERQMAEARLSVARRYRSVRRSGSSVVDALEVLLASDASALARGAAAGYLSPSAVAELIVLGEWVEAWERRVVRRLQRLVGVAA